jgi:3-methyl-2-oxobutanoate hydroxymethyltransferase|tara:strand:- start:345 stop:1121 length:777 start_codon:yes stop_codon:yes gene_type:complete
MNNKIKKIINKKNRSKIVCLTAYSKNIAEIIDNHVDITLVGDSLGSVLYNYNTTRKVNLKMMLEHTKSVRMGVKKSLLVIDLPYNTYRNKSEALKNSKKAIKETKCDAVKIEGGIKVKDIVRHLVKNKIPVLGHIGITPQTVKGKFKSKGKTETEKRKLINDAKELEKSGAFGIVLECIYSDISKKITNLIKIPTIGIGASVHCDGQVLVTDDILGLTNAKIKFVKKYTNVKKIVNSAVLKFKKEVKSEKYPSKKYSY